MPRFIPLLLLLPALAVAQDRLPDAESARLRELGSGVRDDLRSQDFPLVAKALASNNTEDRQWACLAIEKICVMPGIPSFADANRVAQASLNRAYVDQCVPQLLAAIDATDFDLREYACRAIGSLVEYTALLTPTQVARSCDTAVAGLWSDDFEDRRRCVILLGHLTRRLDFANEKEKLAVDRLLDVVEDWQRFNHFKWGEWQRELAARGTAKQRFQDQAVRALLRSCEFIPDKTQVLRAYQFLTSGLQNGSLDLRAVVGIAALASRLPTGQRNQAVELAMEGITDARFWHDVGSGRRILRNYAADALCYLAPSLDKGEVDQALTTIGSQRWNREQSKVFDEARKALRGRLTHLSHKAS